MTLLFLDGFDVGDFKLKWLHTSADGGDASMSAITPFGAGQSLKIPAGTEAVAGVPFTFLKRAIPAASATVIVGFNYRYSAASFATDVAILTLYSHAGATSEIALGLRTDGTLDIYNGSPGVLIGSGPASAMHPDVWYFIEVKAAVSGAIVVRVNEAVVATLAGTVSGADFDALALNRTVSHPNANSTPDQYFSDLYICNGLDDGVGPANDDFLGIGRVQTLLPSAAGNSTGLTPIPAGPNWDNVNDVPWSAADYNQSGTVGDKDTYTLSDLASSTASVKGIQTVVIAESTDATVHVAAVLRSAGTDYTDPSVALDGAAADVSIVVRETDPATSAAWTVSAVNNLEAGVEIT